jgi:hypothetical protein
MMREIPGHRIPRIVIPAKVYIMSMLQRVGKLNHMAGYKDEKLGGQSGVLLVLLGGTGTKELHLSFIVG